MDHHGRGTRPRTGESICTHRSRHRSGLVRISLPWSGGLHHLLHLRHLRHLGHLGHLGHLRSRELTTHDRSLYEARLRAYWHCTHGWAHRVGCGHTSLLEVLHLLRYLSILDEMWHTGSRRRMHRRLGCRKLHVMAIKVGCSRVVWLHRRMARSVLRSVHLWHALAALC